MKLMSFIAVFVFCMNSQAQYFLSKDQVAVKKIQAQKVDRTVSAVTTVWLPTQNWHEGGFEATEFPMVGCWGIPYGARAAQFGEEFQVNERGCGNSVEFCPANPQLWNGYHNMNSLTCAKKVDVKYDTDYIKVLSVEVDAEGCEFWDQTEMNSFEQAVKAAGAYNFDLTAADVKVDMSKAKIQQNGI